MAPIIDLYSFPPSPPCRAVLLTAKAVGVSLNLKTVNLMEGEHLTPDYLKMNPQHSIPTMNDNGLVVWESRPIMSYLVDMYATNDALYPKDPQQRVIVDQRLYFDMGTLYHRLLEYFAPVLHAGAAPDDAKKDKFDEAMGYLELFLEDSDWVAGVGMTIADISIIVTVSTAEAIGMDISKFDNVSAWYDRAKKALAPFGYDEINQAGANTIGGIFRSKLP